MAKRSGKSSGSAPRITPRRQAAIDAYTKATGRAPKKTMSIKAMTDAVSGERKAPSSSGGRKVGTPTYQATPAGTSVVSRDGMVLHADRGWITVEQAAILAKPRVAVSTNDTHMGHSAPVAQSPSLAARAKSMMPSASTVSTAMMATGIAVSAGRGYRDAKAEGNSTGEAVVAGAKSAAVPAAIAAAPAIAKGAGHVATGAFELSGALLRDAGGFTDLVTSLAISKAAIGTGALGVAAKGVELAAKGVSRVAMPALAAYSGYQGAKEAQAKGESMTVGAARGVVRAFDPSAIFMKRGVGERVFDAGVNAASRLSSGQQRSFAQANAHYAASHMGHDDSASYQVGAGKRGFGNPVNQAAAQRAKGNKYEGPSN